MEVNTLTKSQTSEQISVEVKSVLNILCEHGLIIPHYQRPYKWQQRHVGQLLNDILHFKDKSAYRLGALVLDTSRGSYDLVDGQQRSITLSLIIRAYLNFNKTPKIPELKRCYARLQDELFDPGLKHPISRSNAKQNYLFISQNINKFSEENILFLLKKCEFVVFKLDNLSTAFQFFDSQNARGQELEPHDLLKAYHLRAFSKEDKAHEERVTREWEQTPTKELAALFHLFLYRIKEWSWGNSARFFTKSNVDLFKGADLYDKNLPYTQLYRIARLYVDTYNHSQDRLIDFQKLSFPFQLDMPVINGRMFFEMIAYYLAKQRDLQKTLPTHIKKESKGYRVMKTLQSYDGRNRIGDQYLRHLYDAVLLQYVDKFGYDHIDEVLQHLFVWVYQLRLNYQRILLATMDNHAKGPESYLMRIQRALKPEEVIKHTLPTYIDIGCSV
ncbi:MAG: DUF262 domain-containing protein [Phaeodactylibacter sp.]|uniref:DUF262 domain-containing protein n=1 Tax=Phaeodactylibacter sp. TaxID=1940289 RepID=UPI0032EC35FD